MKKLLILDIDETLLHASNTPLAAKPDFTLEKYHIYKRPHLDQFLSFCLDHFEVAIWTTASEAFANSIARELFEEPENLEFIWTEDKCTMVYNHQLSTHQHLKNLAKVKKKGFDLDHVIMVDDSPYKLKKNYGNLVRVNEFTGDQHDTELLILIDYLSDLKSAHNIRQIEKRGWQNKY